MNPLRTFAMKMRLPQPIKKGDLIDLPFLQSRHLPLCWEVTDIRRIGVTNQYNVNLREWVPTVLPVAVEVVPAPVIPRARAQHRHGPEKPRKARKAGGRRRKTES